MTSIAIQLPAETHVAADDSTPRAAPPWIYDPGATYPEEDVAARMQDEGIDRAEAIRRYHVQDAVSALEPEATWPSTFAGLWIDHEPTFGVKVAFTRDAAVNVEALRADFAFPDELHAVEATVPLNVLRQIQARMRADRTELQAGGAPRLPKAIRDTKGRYDLGMDVRSNALVVHVDKVTTELRDAFRATYNGRLDLDEGVSAPATCTQTDCRYAMMGGLVIDIPSGTPGVGETCSSGFTAYSGPTYYVLSAGHCGDNASHVDQGYARVHAGSTYGYVTKSTVSGNVDAERVKHYYAPWRESAHFWLEDSNPRLVHNYMSTSYMRVGDYVGKSGATTGTTRGYILDLTYASFFPGSFNFVLADFCVQPGDSGSGVWSGNAAWGILSASSPGTCHKSAGVGGVGGRGIFGVIDAALQNLGLNLLESVDLPPDVPAFTYSCSGPRCDFTDGGSYDEDGSVRTYSWTFGDGGTASGSSVSHDFTGQNQSYTVTEGVSDNDGVSASSTRTIVTGAVSPPTLDSVTSTLIVCENELDWTPPSFNSAPDGYDVYRSVAGGPYSLWQHITGGNVTSTVDTGVASSTTYSYYLKSTLGIWRSSNSNTRSATTSAVCI